MRGGSLGPGAEGEARLGRQPEAGVRVGVRCGAVGAGGGTGSGEAGGTGRSGSPGGGGLCTTYEVFHRSSTSPESHPVLSLRFAG